MAAAMARSTFPLAVFATLALTVLAGCTSGGDEPEPTYGPNERGTGAYRLDCTISNWVDACTALASPNQSPAKAEIDLAVNPTNPLNVFVASKDKDLTASSCVWAVGQYTMDGGKTWNTTYIGGQTADRQPGDALWGWECITDPIMQFAPDGTLHYSLQVYRYNPAGVPRVSDPLTGLVTAPPEGGNMYHTVSRDGGKTFSEPILMHAGDSGLLLFHDYMHMGHNPATGTVFTVWNQLSGFATSQPVLVAVESGSPVARPPVYFPQDISPTGLGASGVAGANDGTVYAWLAGFNSGGNAVMATSTDDGRTFGIPTLAFEFAAMGELEAHPCSNCPTYEDPAYCPSEAGMYNPCYRTGTVVELAIDNSGGANDGCLYAVWGGQEDDAVGPSDIYMRRSCDKGTTWDEPVLVNTLHREDAQWMPRVTVDGSGTIHIVHVTRAYDPEHNFMDAEWDYSTDGGKTWTQERVTSRSFDGNLGIHQEGFPFIGDYIGIGAVGDDVYMGFPSTVTGAAEIAVAHAHKA